MPDSERKVPDIDSSDDTQSSSSPPRPQYSASQEPSSLKAVLSDDSENNGSSSSSDDSDGDGAGGPQESSVKPGESTEATASATASAPEHPAAGSPDNEEDDSEEESEESEEESEDNSAQRPSKAQHGSSMSFARTVSHEPNFHDEDEGDWNVSQNEPDPFKFMGPSDRTNSFPVVPPIASASANNDEPLTTSQALDVMQESDEESDESDESEEESEEESDEQESDEQESDEGASQNQPDLAQEATRQAGTATNPPGKSKHSHSRSIGGDIQGHDGAADEARYAEGIPLLSEGGATGNVTASFDDEDGDDEFFAQVQETGKEPDIQPLQRKSTMQVLASMTPEPASQTPLEGTLEVEEEEDRPTDKNTEAGTDAAGLGISLGSEQATESVEPPTTEDLAAKWQEAFASDDEDEFLVDDAGNANKTVDPAAFWGSDDEGFLEEDEGTVETTQPPQPAPISRAASYAPQTLPGASATPIISPVSNPLYSPQFPTSPYNTVPGYGTVQPQRPEVSKAESFADKTKGGYSSPYDLPTDLVNTALKPRKRPSMQQLASAPASQSSQVPPPPSSAKGNGFAPELYSHTAPPTQKPTPATVSSKNGFFEDLPITIKPRSASRQSNRVPSPALHGSGSFSAGPSPMAPPMGPPAGQIHPPPAQRPPSSSGSTGEPQHAGISNLVAPDRISPYAALDSSAPPMPPPSSNATRYSPAPKPTSTGPPAVSARYSPAPVAARSNHGYGPAVTSPVPPAMLPHQPRTSSPLAHFEFNHNKTHAGSGANGDAYFADRRTSSSYEPRLNRISSLPPTREVDEELEQSVSADAAVEGHLVNGEARYSPVAPPAATLRQTPPPPTGVSGQPILSPRKTSSNYAPQPAAAAYSGSIAPPRSQTQSPGRPATRSSESGRHTSSTHSPTSPVLAKAAPQPGHSRARGQSLTMQIVPPTDGREQDPLQRWKGVPIIAWGVGGTVVTTFPKSVPRYGLNQTVPTIYRTPGEVHVKNIREYAPLSDRLIKFPGPLKGKSKKKEALSWLTTVIDSLEKELPEVSFHAQLSPDDKRAVERLLLWKIIRVFVEFDGTLEGSPAVEKAVRDILSPGTMTPTADNDALFPATVGAQTAPVTSMQADGADAAAMDQIRHHLLRGDREAAVWAAADKRLWAHAMLISNTVSSDLYKRVAQEFVRKEVNFPGHNNESIGALYKVLSGNFDDCVDELVPVHARAGLQLLSTAASLDSSVNNADGLDKWRETLTLILSNRSTDDVRGLHALGNLLSSYGRPEAAHVCFLFSRQVAVNGGLDDPNASFTLLGIDQRHATGYFAKDLEAVQLSEIYEYGLSLSGVAIAANGLPHLAAYKFQHAMALAEYGHRDKALAYCDTLLSAMASQTRRSPYHHAILEATIDDFATRLRQAPKDGTSSWISKPSMNKVSDSMWNRFNKFVAGDENDATGKASTGETENGPFARIATTPTMSRSPSISNFEPYGGGSPNYGANVVPPTHSAASSRYASMAGQPGQPAPAMSMYEPASQYAPSSQYTPSSQYAPATGSSLGRSSSEALRSPYEYAPQAAASGSQPLQNNSAPAPYGLQESPNIQSSYGTGQQETESPALGYQPTTFGYEPPQTGDAPSQEHAINNNGASTSGYEAPSFQPYGYEPPSYDPGLTSTADDDDEPKPKKKSFMDDDEDDIPALKAQDKSKAEKDRENEEMFRKAAEEDGELFSRIDKAPVD